MSALHLSGSFMRRDYVRRARSFALGGRQTRPDGGARPIRFQSLRRMHDSFRRWGISSHSRAFRELVTAARGLLSFSLPKLRTLMAAGRFTNASAELPATTNRRL